MHINTLQLASFQTPAGDLWSCTDDRDRVHALQWDRAAMLSSLRRRYGDALTLTTAAPPRAIVVPLRAYFAGELHALNDIVTCAIGTAFQRKVWQALRTIPAGATLSYGALAMQIGHPKAIRAVGLANASNPCGIVVPCHRVIGADGSLTGYAGGLERKRWLLMHEGAL